MNGTYIGAKAWIPCLASWKYTTNSSTRPTTNVGIEMPIRTNTVADRSRRLRARVALSTPTPMPTISHRTAPPMISDRVGGRSALIVPFTGAPVKNEVPRSPCSSLSR